MSLTTKRRHIAAIISPNYGNISSSFGNVLEAYFVIVEPKTFAEVFAAMKNEILALEKNNTWSIVTLPPGKMPIGYK